MNTNATPCNVVTAGNNTTTRAVPDLQLAIQNFSETVVLDRNEVLVSKRVEAVQWGLPGLGTNRGCDSARRRVRNRRGRGHNWHAETQLTNGLRKLVRAGGNDDRE